MVRPYGTLVLGMEQKERNQQKTVVFTWEEEIQSRDLCREPKRSQCETEGVVGSQVLWEKLDEVENGHWGGLAEEDAMAGLL